MGPSNLVGPNERDRQSQDIQNGEVSGRELPWGRQHDRCDREEGPGRVAARPVIGRADFGVDTIISTAFGQRQIEFLCVDELNHVVWVLSVIHIALLQPAHMKIDRRAGPGRQADGVHARHMPR